MTVEEEFIDFIVGALMKGQSVDSIVSGLVAGGMAEEDATEAVTNINEQLRSSEFHEIMAAIERELEGGKSVEDVVAGIVSSGIPEEKARPVVLMMAMQIIMKRGDAEAFVGSVINALIIIGKREELEENLKRLGIPDDISEATLKGIEALASAVEREDRGENTALSVMEDFVRIREALENGRRDEMLDILVSEGFERGTMENFMSAADYFIMLEKNARDTDVKEKNEQG